MADTGVITIPREEYEALIGVPFGAASLHPRTYPKAETPLTPNRFPR